VAHSRGIRFQTRSSPRRKTGWDIGTQTGTDGSPQTLSSSSSQAGTGAVVSTADGVTVVRTRGELVVALAALAGAFEGFHGAFGIGVASVAAITAGIGSLPLPIDDETDENWIYHRYFSIVAMSAINGGVALDEDFTNPVTSALRVEVDSKAMRKLNTGLGLYCAIQVLEIGTASLRWSFNSRMLVKLA